MTSLYQKGTKNFRIGIYVKKYSLPILIEKIYLTKSYKNTPVSFSDFRNFLTFFQNCFMVRGKCSMYSDNGEHVRSILAPGGPRYQLYLVWHNQITQKPTKITIANQILKSTFVFRTWNKFWAREKSRFFTWFNIKSEKLKWLGRGNVCPPMSQLVKPKKSWFLYI